VSSRQALTSEQLAGIAVGAIVAVTAAIAAVLWFTLNPPPAGGAPPPAPPTPPPPSGTPPPPPPVTSCAGSDGTISVAAQSISGGAESVTVKICGQDFVATGPGPAPSYSYRAGTLTFTAPPTDPNGRAFNQWYNTWTGEHVMNTTYSVAIAPGAQAASYLLAAIYN